mmetsp:Transcript_25235/g.42041  ORF Transcript_25235/g.42041 Transcript_25235/m.42041 type:complete len:298 (+) Transcript_25235:2938-3831(+)
MEILLARLLGAVEAVEVAGVSSHVGVEGDGGCAAVVERVLQLSKNMCLHDRSHHDRGERNVDLCTHSGTHGRFVHHHKIPVLGGNEGANQLVDQQFHRQSSNGHIIIWSGFATNRGGFDRIRWGLLRAPQQLHLAHWREGLDLGPGGADRIVRHGGGDLLQPGGIVVVRDEGVGGAHALAVLVVRGLGHRYRLWQGQVILSREVQKPMRGCRLVHDQIYFIVQRHIMVLEQKLNGANTFRPTVSSDRRNRYQCLIGSGESLYLAVVDNVSLETQEVRQLGRGGRQVVARTQHLAEGK